MSLPMQTSAGQVADQTAVDHAAAYAARPWTKRYDTGLSHTLMPYPDMPLHRVLQDAARSRPNSVALVTSAHLPVAGRVHSDTTYKELDDSSDALAAALIAMGVKKGDRVAIVMPNCVQFVIAFFGIMKAGAVVVGTNPTYPAAKMEEQFNDCGCNTVLTITLFYNTVKSIQAKTSVKNVIVANIKDYLPGAAKFLFTVAKEKKTGHRVEVQSGDHVFLDVLKKYAGQKSNVEVKSTDQAIFQYTGGTTGIPKAAVATHAALVANSLQEKSWLGKLDDGEGYMGAIPFFHVFGMVAVLILAMSSGGKIYLAPNPRDMDDLLDIINKFKPSFYMAVPAMYNAINNHPAVLAGKYDLRSIRACVSGSAPLAPITKAKFEELTGGKLLEGYGLSETPTGVSCNPLYGENRSGSIGLPIPDVDMLVVDTETGDKVMPVGEIGELLIRGPQLMQGYYNQPEETAKALRKGPDGNTWFYTGDIARMDEDGYFYIVDRKKDMVLVGGFNVYPVSVEKILAEHSAVKELAVAGIEHPDKPGQESLKAWVVVKEGQTVTEKELMEFAKSRLAYYETPSRYEFVSELPRTAVGKLLRRELQAREKERNGSRDKQLA